MLELLFSQILALITFFAFPAIQYVWLNRFSHKEGQPALWFLPRYGFRLVIRNLPRKHVLSDIKYKSILRRVIPSSQGSSVATYQDELLVKTDDFFLFPGVDQVLVAFQLEFEGSGSLQLVHTDKLGKELARFVLSESDILISDYMARVENWFNFDVRIAKRAELRADTMKAICNKVLANNVEQQFQISQIRSIG